MHPDFSATAIELVRILRGRASQRSLSRRLGYRSNQLHRWESGQARIHWADFAKLCKQTKAPLSRALFSLSLYDGDESDARSILRSLCGNRSQAEVAAAARVTRYKVSRWQSRTSDPALIEILAVIHGCLAGVPTFLNEVTGGKMDRWQAYEVALYRTPWELAVLAAIDSHPYQANGRHREGWIARHIGITGAQERESIQRLAAAELIQHRQNRWMIAEEAMHTTGLVPMPALREILTYWGKRALKYMDSAIRRNPRAIWGYRIFNVAEEDHARIVELYAQFYRELERTLALSKRTRTRTFFMSTQIIDVALMPSLD